MRDPGRWTILAAALALGVCVCVGCEEKGQPGSAAKAGLGGEGPAVPETKPAPAKPVEVEPTPPEEPPPPATIPEVHLTEALQATCLVDVGDAMPDGELTDPSGQKQSLADLRGKKLTLVVFWTRGSTEFSAMAAEMRLEDLQKDVYEPYADKGVQVIAVNEGDEAGVVQKMAAEAGANYPVLLDPDGALFAEVATERLPRPYLLDAEGKILWFDLEFSPITRDKLMQAISVALGERGES